MFKVLMTPEQVKLRDEARELARSIPREYILDMEADKIKYPRDFLQEAAKRNLIGIRVPRQYGGRGLKWEEAVIAAEEIGVPGYIFACTWGITGELVAEAILHFGTEEQRERWLPDLMRGNKFAAECLTEPRGGSDFFGATTVARQEGDHFILNGQKRFIVGGEGADMFLVYARTDPSVPAQKGMTCFVVERGEGVRTDYLYGLLGCHGGGTARLVFDQVRVPKENVIGEVNGAFPVFTRMMVPERLGTAAMTVGTARPAVEVATEYTTHRKAFGTEIRNFEGVSFKIADAVTQLDSSRAMCYTVARCIDAGISGATGRRLVSECKKFVTEQCWAAVNLAMQTMGGIGYTNIYPIEKIVRDMRLSMIWVGSNEIMNLITQHEW
jgi:alkylation response protein AidB-like acyl-CoA dehydrogenase